MDAVKLLRDAAKVQTMLSAYNINWYEALTLIAIGRNNGRERSGNLANWSGLKQATTSAALKRFEQSGLITRDLDPIDRRGMIISLTKMGWQQYQKLEKVMEGLSK